MSNFIVILFILLNLFQIKDKPQSYIERTRLRFEPAYSDDDPSEVVKNWKVPFKTTDRYKLKTIKVISTFGAKRDTYLTGHIHTAIDIIPSKPENYNYVYPIADGVVCSIHLGHPHKTIVIKHKLPDSTFVFSSYKHLQEIYVENGTEVNQDTKLARLYTRAEAKKQGGNYDHLHLEIRKSFDDYGCASWLTMTKDELNKYFFDPLDFLKKNLGEIK